MFPTRHIFFQDLVDQLLQLKQEEQEIVLMGNFNKDVYEDRLTTRIPEDELQLSEQCLLVTGKGCLPHSHVGVPNQ